MNLLKGILVALVVVVSVLLGSPAPAALSTTPVSTPKNPFAEPVAEAGQCLGPKPVKPVRPAGCKELVILCTCDPQGNKCEWEWVCTN